MLEFQRILMADSIRNEAFARALKKIVKKGDVVADIGSGTGFLSFLASQLGAEECHLYEQSEGMLDLSKTLAAENKIENCVFHHAHSHVVKNPIKADVIVSETLGNFAYEEHLIENMEDAKRFLKPGGTLIPCGLTNYVAPVISDRLHREIDIWNGIGHHLKFDAAREATMQNIYVKTIMPDELPGEKSIQVWDEVDFTKKNKSVRSASLQWSFSEPQTIYGFALFWEATLVPGITLSTSPWKPRTHWEQIFLPLLSPLKIKPQDHLSLAITSDSRHETGLNVTWQVVLKDAKGKEMACEDHDMRKGAIE